MTEQPTHPPRPRWRRRRVLLGVAALCLMGIAAAYVVFIVGSAGSETRVEGWVADRLRLLVNDRLNATLSFEDLDYEYPGTVTLRDVRLVVPTDEAGGGHVEMLRLPEAVLTLAEVPSVNKPLQVRLLRASGLTLDLCENDAGGIAGLDQLVKTAGADDASTAQAPPKLSDIVRLHRIELEAVSLRFTPRSDNPPLLFDRVSLAGDLDHANVDELVLDFALRRAPALDIELDAVLNTADYTLRVDAMKAGLDLSSHAVSTLPPIVQGLLERYAVTGDVLVTADGSLPLLSPLDAALNATLVLGDASAVVAGLVYPVERVELTANLGDRLLTAGTATGRALGGTFTLLAQLELDRGYPANVRLNADALQLEERTAEAAADEANKPPFTGTITGDVQWQGPLSEALVQAGGGGSLQLTQARLARLPVLSRLLEHLNKLRGSPGANDRAALTFEFRGDHLYFTDINAAASAVGVKGEGRLDFDGQLNLVVRAGPLERFQDSLGRLGDLLSTALAVFPRYRVTGSYEDPQVMIAPPTASAE